MALGTPTVVLADAQASAGQSSYTTTATYAPAANTVYSVLVHFGNASGDVDPQLSGWSATWTRERSTDAFGRRSAVFSTVTGGSPGSGALTVSRGSGSQTWAACAVRAVEHPGASHVVQTWQGTADFEQTHGVDVALSTGAGFFAHASKWAVNETATPRSGWTERYDDNTGSGETWTVHGQYRNSDDSRAEVTWASGTGVSEIVVLELAEAGSTLTQSAYRHYADDDVPGDATPLAAQNAPVTIPRGETVRTRIQLDATGDPDAISAQLEYLDPDLGWRKIE